jgi:hypothetical protein
MEFQVTLAAAYIPQVPLCCMACFFPARRVRGVRVPSSTMKNRLGHDAAKVGGRIMISRCLVASKRNVKAALVHQGCLLRYQ